MRPSCRSAAAVLAACLLSASAAFGQIGQLGEIGNIPQPMVLAPDTPGAPTEPKKPVSVSGFAVAPALLLHMPRVLYCEGVASTGADCMAAVAGADGRQ